MASPFSLSGIGLHTGTAAAVTVEPAGPGDGITFVRAVEGKRSRIPASLDYAVPSDRRTLLERDGVSVSTVEHLLAALYASRIDDATIVIDGDEVPLLDGSARPFVEAIVGTGVTQHDVYRSRFVVKAPISTRVGDAAYEVNPCDRMTLAVTITFDHPAIGTQRIASGLSFNEFSDTLAGARTFGFLREGESLREQGLIRGATLANVIVLTESGLYNGQRLRWPDEFVRHKALDLVGDLALLGAVVHGEIRATKPSHAGNLELARAIAAGALRVPAGSEAGE